MFRVVLLLAALLPLLLGCWEQAPVSGSANLICYYQGKVVASMELEITGTSLQYGDVSILEGSWELCNWETEVTCVYNEKKPDNL